MKNIKFYLLIFFTFLVNTLAFSSNYFFENPKTISNEKFSCVYPSSINAKNKNQSSAFFWQEVDSEKKEIFISMFYTKDGLSWNEKSKFLGPYYYENEIPNIYSVCQNSNGTIFIAISDSESIVNIFSSKDFFENIKSVVLKDKNKTFVSPRLFLNSKNELVLFASKIENDSFSIISSISKDGQTWSDFIDLPITENLPNTFNPIVPHLKATQNGDLLIFQAQYTQSNLISIQLYACTSKDGGRKWTQPIIITDNKSVENQEKFYNYSNQSVSILNSNNKLYIAWEKSDFNSSNANIYFAEINSNGTLKTIPEKITTSGYVSRPLLFENEKNLNILYFTYVNNNQKVFLTEKIGLLWSEPIVLSTSNATYPCYILHNEKLYLTWQNQKANSSNIIFLSADHTTPSPKIKGLSFNDNERSNNSKVQAKVSVSKDSSSVKGFSWIWTQNEKDVPPKQIMNLPEENILTSTADKEGKWYFKIRQADFAGNWSDTISIAYFLDTTPPEAVEIIEPETDEFGLQKSNTFSLTWDADSEDSDIAGYTWSLNYIDSIPKALATNSRHPTKLDYYEINDAVDKIYEENQEKLDQIFTNPKQILTKKNNVKFNNIKNGLYVFSVAAIDKVGNIGEASTIEILLNKYVPITYINSINAKTTKFGDTIIDIFGGGFLYDGKIKEIYIDKDGLVPYDTILKLENNEFKILSDNSITNITVKNLNSGSYKIGLFHTDRGLYFSKKNILEVKESGTIKNKIKYIFNPAWSAIQKSYNSKTNATTFIIIILSILLIIGILSCSKFLIDAIKESKIIKAEVKALLEGDIMPEDKKRNSKQYKKIGFSLKAKLILNTIVLITFMDILIFITLGYYMITIQRNTLAESLQNRVDVMMESIASGSKIYLPQTTSSDNLSLTDITNQSSALEESLYATIIAHSEDKNTTNMDYIWATNDKNISSKIDTKDFIPGTSRLVIPEIKEIIKASENLNNIAFNNASEISNNISELTKEAMSLIRRSDENSILRRNEIQNIRNQLSSRLDLILNKISKEGSGSIPYYNPKELDTNNTEYIFYKPIIYHQNNDQNYVHGIILIKISTQDLLNKISNQKDVIIKTALVIMLLSLTLSFISTYIISSVIVKPINKLADHVAMIRDTEDKEVLSGKEIILKGKDEIKILGDTVNDMTKGLVEAAVQSKNLTFGKEVQIKFIPLQNDENGNTLTTGFLNTKGANFFSYYAGADDLSGDYFDYKALDDKHFAIIKCDVSGHGVPAALIMVEVATLFLNYFKNWNMKNPKQGTNLAPVVGQINDLLESRGFKERFAAFTLCIFNSETGECWFCNAGDNQIQIYDNQIKEKKTITLPESPAAGMFSTDLIEMKGGYKVSKLLLKKDDILFLYTDGIEEAKRKFRNENYELIACDEEGLNVGDEHENHVKGEESEELSANRVSNIINSVYRKEKFTLIKYHNPDKIQNFEFDFTTCEHSAEDAIMALVSVEKIFRMYKPTETKITDKVKVDKKIDEFLRKHFIQYSTYCGDKQEIENDPTHIYYKGVCEDPQYDDLTLIAIKKN